MTQRDLTRDTWRKRLPSLIGDGLTLREPQVSDVPSLYTRLSCDEVARLVSSPSQNLTGFEDLVASMRRERTGGRGFSYCVVPDGQPQPAGLFEVRCLEPGTAQLGFAVDEQFGRSEHCAVAARFVTDFTLRHLTAHRLEVRTTLDDRLGHALLRSIGAVPEGVLRDVPVAVRDSADHVLWSVLADEWLPRHESAPYLYNGSEPEPLEAPDARPGQTPAWHSAHWLEAPPVLTCPGVTVRELRADDAAALLETLEPAEESQFLNQPPESIDELVRFIEWSRREREAGEGICFAIVPSGSARIAGLFQLRHLGRTARVSEWGFVLGRSYWGTGLFIASALLVLQFAFEVAGIRRLEGRAVIENHRGNGAMRKLGAVREACLRRSFRSGNDYYDDALWSIVARDWHERRHTFAAGVPAPAVA